MKPVFLFLSLVAFLHSSAQKVNAEDIVNSCIKIHGGDKYNNAHFTYDFRKYHFEYHYNDGQYRYVRHSKDGKTKDILTNEGFKRTVDGRKVDLTEKQIRGFSNSVNSVHYFTFLPFFLNDKAVYKKLLGESTIKGKNYYKIQVTFAQDGGGDDHDDVYMYWIGKDDYNLDYLAYSFEVNGGGVRFRSAYNKRTVGGIIFQDYVNYKHDKETPVSKLDELFERNELIELTKIELVNIERL